MPGIHPRGSGSQEPGVTRARCQFGRTFSELLPPSTRHERPPTAPIAPPAATSRPQPSNAGHGARPPVQHLCGPRAKPPTRPASSPNAPAKGRPPPGGRAGVAERSRSGCGRQNRLPRKLRRCVGPSYQPATRRGDQIAGLYRLCCRIVSTHVEATGPTKSGFSATAAFFDLDKTLIARSSTLAFGPSFYRHGLLSRADMMRGALAQLRYRVSGADHRQMEKLRASACAACRGWPADRVAEIVSRYLKDLILPYVYAEARALLSEHRSAGQDVIIVSTSGEEVVVPIGALLGA